jgi:hypothetical protein
MEEQKISVERLQKLERIAKIAGALCDCLQSSQIRADRYWSELHQLTLDLLCIDAR